MKIVNVKTPRYYIVSSSKYDSALKIPKNIYKSYDIGFKYGIPSNDLEVKRNLYSEFERDGPFSKEEFFTNDTMYIFNSMIYSYD